MIDSRFEDGRLKVGEVVFPGKSDDCIVFCAHLDHPAQANDGLSGVAVGIEVMRQIAKRKGLRYTYRLVIVPETIGSIAYLSHNEDLLPFMRGGLFLEMMGTDKLLPTLQHSYHGDSQADLCFLAGLAEINPLWKTRTGKFREIIENDERQFNAPGVRVPMLSLSRLHLPGDQRWPYPEYHTSLDTPDLMSEKELAESVQIVLKMIDVWEGNWYPEPKFSGEIFLSGYGLFIDNTKDPNVNDRLTDVMFCPGRRILGGRDRPIHRSCVLGCLGGCDEVPEAWAGGAKRSPRRCSVMTEQALPSPERARPLATMQ